MNANEEAPNQSRKFWKIKFCWLVLSSRDLLVSNAKENETYLMYIHYGKLQQVKLLKTSSRYNSAHQWCLGRSTPRNSWKLRFFFCRERVIWCGMEPSNPETLWSYPGMQTSKENENENESLLIPAVHDIHHRIKLRSILD